MVQSDLHVQIDTSKGGRRSLRQRAIPIVAGIFVLAVTLGLGEGAARIVYNCQDDIGGLPFVSMLLRKGMDLDPFEQPSSKIGNHWVLKPGYVATNEPLLTEKERSRKTQSAETLRAAQQQPTWRKELFRVNSLGFKGPEIDLSDPRLRILSLGDSVTFGVGPYGYPKELGKSLAARGIDAIVINGGVQGYAEKNLLYEIDRYKKVKPEIVTIMIGWNSLYTINPWPESPENRLKFVWLLKKAYSAARGIMGLRAKDAQQLYSKKIYGDREATEVRALTGYVPPSLKKVEKLVAEIQDMGARVVIMTLPGLFTLDDAPTERSLRIGHLPAFTSNIYVLARLTELFNDGLRDLVRRRNVSLIDIDLWSRQAFHPRDKNFTDSVHLMPEAMEMIGQYMAANLATMIKQLAVSQ